MATPRLPFLYPNLMRAVRSCEPSTYRSLRFPYPPNRRFHISRRHEREAYQRRYGPAVEPSVPAASRLKKSSSDQIPEEIPAQNESQDASEQEGASPEESQSDPPQDNQDAANSSSSASPNLDQQESIESKKDDPPTDREPHEESAAEEHSEQDQASASSTSTSGNPPEENTESSPFSGQTPFDEVLHMPSPSVYLTPSGEHSSSDDRPPHLSPAPYVHHFDTYSLVQDLSKGGFSNEHSTTIMKAVRAILQNNLTLANESLTSKSDVENEEYLFKAACSELQSSLQTARNSEVQHQRSSRTQLQHDTDIISQRLSQELAGMRDEIKGMFNDHKMITREQQRSIDTSVQELNYKITVSLNSDGKSEIEGLRWILTRRAALTVAICAFMIIVFLKYASTLKVHEPAKVKEVEKPVVTKEVATETRVVHDNDTTTIPSTSEAHLGESLG
ncbi:hypothetical protein PENANT_c008G01075 [Penicillium antarcticum]|uniref:MOZ protein represents a chromatin-associated acetyltransferase n=1 Tax=Penicillium antarcticum TaxID=416450 RepID=A0A1V6QAI3_9EURO|nr:uncharacterized protein N7508_007114 [Penicillium antarcticum]KAJ5302251.1 hypothetical protein N7508_007114 [Penicillium antarcticum]OQD86230.1 hypothetical protein PENANT_c008G01075 [Penicillium antarcticum]